MEVTQGNMAALFQGLNGAFLRALGDVKIPDAMTAFVMEAPSSTGLEQYPTAALLGDLEELLDELAMTNIAEFMQTVKNVRFERGYGIPRDHVDDDNLGMYPAMSASLARRAALHPYRRVPNLFINGFATPWVDGANVFSNTHVWPGGQRWDNLDGVPLTANNFEFVCRHLMERQGPDGEAMELTPTHLIVGPANWVNALNIIHRALVAGGSTNIHYEEVEVVKWSRLRGAAMNDWFVVDASDVKPVIYQKRSGPEFVALTQPTDEPVFRRERFEYKGAIRYGSAIVAPWLIQASQMNPTTTTTTTQAP